MFDWKSVEEVKLLCEQFVKYAMAKFDKSHTIDHIQWVVQTSL